MARAFVIGNGISRKGIDLSTLKTVGKVYGCNALYREFTPDVLIATDRPIATQIQESGYAQTNRFYTRKPIVGLGALALPEAYQGYSSGPNALGIAALDANLIIYMLGFDMGPTEKQQFNNVYAGTEFYKNPESAPTFTGNWIKQLIRIMNDHPQIQFVRVCGSTTARIAELEAIKNLEHQELTLFTDRINNKKDF
jgi:hypothetical protein